MHASLRPFALAAVVAGGLVIAARTAHAGPAWISIEIPTNPHNRTISSAWFLVRTYHHWQPVETALTGTAEGLVNGVRRSVKLEFTKAPVAGAYAVMGDVPTEGAWLVVIRAPGLDGATALVSLGADGQVSGAEVPANTTNDGWKVPRQVTDADIESALRKHAAQLASADRKPIVGMTIVGIGLLLGALGKGKRA